MQITNKDIQEVLKFGGYYNGPINGILEPGITDTFSDKISFTWPWQRKLMAIFQITLKELGFPEVGQIDGLQGMLTEHAFENWQHYKGHGQRPLEQWRPDDDSSSLESFYGKAGSPACTKGQVVLPFPMKLAWDKDTVIYKFACHEKVAKSATQAYREIASIYSSKDISRLGFDIFGGCYNFRKKRGGKTLSTHAYGIAIDHDPQRNQLRWNSTRASLAHEECERFWKCWEAQGWSSLGRKHNFDWMHVQATK